MQVDLEPRDAEHVVLSITVPRSDVDSEMEEAARKVRSKVAVNGFRQGQAPLDLIKSQYSNALRAEVAARLIQNGVLSGLRQHSLKHVGNPILLEEFRVTEKKRYPGNFKLDGSFTFKIEVELPPQLDVTDYIGIEAKSLATPFEEWFAQQMRRNQLLFGERQDANRPSEKGDQMLVNFEGLDNGDPVPGATQTSHSVVLGEVGLVPDLEAIFYGRSAGEEFEADVTFNSPQANPGVRGKTLHFKAKVLEVVTLTPAPIDDTLATLVSFDDLAAMRAHFLNKWETEYKPIANQGVATEILQKLIDRYPFSVPQSWVESEIRKILPTVNLKMEDLKGNEALFDQIKSLADKTARSNYILSNIYQKEPTIHLTEKEIVDFASSTATQHQTTATQYLNTLQERGLYETFVTQCENRKTLDFLVASAAIKE
jgi:trigger factor